MKLFSWPEKASGLEVRGCGAALPPSLLELRALLRGLRGDGRVRDGLAEVALGRDERSESFTLERNGDGEPAGVCETCAD